MALDIPHKRLVTQLANNALGVENVAFSLPLVLRLPYPKVKNGAEVRLICLSVC